MEPMSKTRFNVPVCFVKERFICAFSGLLNHKMPTLTCEGFDTVKQKWFKMESLDKARHSTSAIVMNNMSIYLMPGISAAPSTSVEIFTLDLKQANRYSTDDLNYIKALAV